MFEDGTQVERAVQRYVPGAFLAEPEGGRRENGCHRETLHDPDGDARFVFSVFVFGAQGQLIVAQVVLFERVGRIGAGLFTVERPFESRSVAVGDRGGDDGFASGFHLHHPVVADGERDLRGQQPVHLDAQLLFGFAVRGFDAEDEEIDARFPGLERESRSGAGRFVVENPCVDGAFSILDRRGDRHRFADLHRINAVGIVQRNDGFGSAVRDYVVLVAGCEQRQEAAVEKQRFRII